MAPTADASERAVLARTIIDRSLYMVLATADAHGRRWATPVYFAPDGYREFFWVSSPDTTHSRNIGVRPEVGIVVFDSGVPIGTGQGVYMEATVEELSDAELDHGLAVFSRRSVEHGGSTWGRDDINPGELMMYRANVVSYSMLAKDGQPDHRVPIQID